MVEGKFLKKLFEIDPSRTVAPEGSVFYDMDNDAFFRWEGGHLIKYVREAENGKNIDNINPMEEGPGPEKNTTGNND